MSVARPKTSHLERTAVEPRETGLHRVRIRDVQQVNTSIRLFKLGIPEDTSFKFFAGQWLDTYVPSTPKAGGFTITSPPSKASASSPRDDRYPYLELAIQESPSNPPAAYLFRPVAEIIGTELRVRVGGSFVFPPPHVPAPSIRRVVFIAGGVGINPLVSMLSHLADMAGRIAEDEDEVDVQFLYSTKVPGNDAAGSSIRHILFLERLVELFGKGRVRGHLHLFLTGSGHAKTGNVTTKELGIETCTGRITAEDMKKAVGSKKEQSIVYVCGVPAMTDEFLTTLTSSSGLGVPTERVFYEKWW